MSETQVRQTTRGLEGRKGKDLKSLNGKVTQKRRERPAQQFEREAEVRELFFLRGRSCHACRKDGERQKSGWIEVNQKVRQA